jgi:high-affinity K+ transport system ATPase subunit B
MDDKELIKRIMEEVKDEKLREELLRCVAKGEGRGVEKILRRIEHRLKAQDSLAKQEIMHGRTEKIAKIEWWDQLVSVPLFYVLWVSIFSGIILFLAYNIFGGFAKIPKLTLFLLGLVWVLMIVNAMIQVYYRLEGKREYERLKMEEKELEK